MTTPRIDATTWTAMAAVLYLVMTSPAAAAPPGGGEPEICDDGIDNDGDRKVDCDDRDCREDPSCTGDDGSGGGDSTRYDYEALPTVERGAGTLDISEDRNWIGGYAVRSHPCVTYVQGPALWERDPGGGWTLHELDALAFGGHGYATGVLDGGTAVGWDETYSADCSERVTRPVIWEPTGGGWAITELPWPGTSGGHAQSAADIAGMGIVIVGAADSTAQLWRRDGTDWVRQSLGSLDDSSAAYGVSSSGAVVGVSTLADATEPRPFIVVPADTDADGVPDTWYQDADADGRNDLMAPLDDAGRAFAVNAAASACGNAPGATHWTADGAGGWTATTLPIGEFSEGTAADQLNGADQVVGDGRRPKGRKTEQRALLWEQAAGGDWSLTNLNDVTELPNSTVLRTAGAINECGDVIGSAKTRDANSQPCILTPRSSPCD